jgi:hypothetical protein
MIDRDQSPPDEFDAELEAEAAAREAAQIGGPDPEPGVDPAEKPLIEGGEGVAEGYELAEHDLEEAASHGDSAVPRSERDPEDDRIDPTYGEADDVIPQGDDEAR